MDPAADAGLAPGEVPAAPTGASVARTYGALGVEHILTGFDHLLFVLGLILLSPGMRQLFWAITAFTAAHSLTLAAATLGFVHVPQRAVEAVIALSIVFVAAEIIHAPPGPRQSRRARALAGGLRLWPAARVRFRRRAERNRDAAGLHSCRAPVLQPRRRGGATRFVLAVLVTAAGLRRIWRPLPALGAFGAIHT